MSDPTAPPLDEVDIVLQEFDQAEDKVKEQHGILLSKQEQVRQTREESEDNIRQAFAQVRDILNQQETELLDKFAECVKPVDDNLNKIAKEIRKTKTLLKTQRCLAEMLKTGESAAEDLTVEDIKQVQETIETRLKKVGLELQKAAECPSFQTDDAAIQQVKDAKFGKILDGQNTATPAEEQLPGVPGEAEPSDAEASVTTDSVDADLASRLSSTSLDSARSAPSPSAPKPTASEEEPPPPTYWQAVGVSVTSEEPQQEETYYTPPPEPRLVQKTNLMPWHSFPVRKQTDTRSASIVSMATSKRFICIVDKFNHKVKFFRDTGHLVTELYFLGQELYDVTCLGDDDVARFVVTIPSAKSLCFIAISEAGEAKVVGKLIARHGYVGVAKGTTGETVVVTSIASSFDHGVGAEIISTTSASVIQTFYRTPNGYPFKYPRYVATFNDTIIVSDWSLHLVAMFLDNGQGVGQYSGTRDHPLKEPTNVTCDSNGNVYIMDPKNSTIHVIDRNCTQLEVVSLSDKMSHPRLISYNRESKKMIVSSKMSFLHVFIANAETVRVTAEETEQTPHVAGMLPSTVQQSARGKIQVDPSRGQGWDSASMPSAGQNYAVIPGMLASSVHQSGKRGTSPGQVGLGSTATPFYGQVGQGQWSPAPTAPPRPRSWDV